MWTILFFLVGVLAQERRPAGPSTLDYETFKTKIQPILLAKRPGHAHFPRRSILRDHAGKVEPVKKDVPLRLAHPVDLRNSGEWSAWQTSMVSAGSFLPGTLSISRIRYWSAIHLGRPLKCQFTDFLRS